MLKKIKTDERRSYLIEFLKHHINFYIENTNPEVMIIKRSLESSLTTSNSTIVINYNILL